MLMTKSDKEKRKKKKIPNAFIEIVLNVMQILIRPLPTLLWLLCWKSEKLLKIKKRDYCLMSLQKVTSQHTHTKKTKKIKHWLSFSLQEKTLTFVMSGE